MITLSLLAIIPSHSLVIVVILLSFLRGFLGWGTLVPIYLSFRLFIDQLPAMILVITILLLIFMLLSTKPSPILVVTFMGLVLLLYFIISTTSII